MSFKLLDQKSCLSDYFVFPKSILEKDCNISLKRLLILIYEGCSHVSHLCRKNPHLNSLFDNFMGDATVTYQESLLASLCNVSVRQLKRLVSSLGGCYGITSSRYYSESLDAFFYDFTLDPSSFSGAKYVALKGSFTLDSSSLFVYIVMVNNLLHNTGSTAVCSYSYISHALGYLSPSTISKAIADLTARGFIERCSSLKRKDKLYSYRVFLSDDVDCFNSLFPPISQLEALNREKSSPSIVLDLLADKNEISEDISGLCTDKNEISEDIFEDNNIILKTFISYRENLNNLSQSLKDKYNAYFAARLVSAKNLKYFHKRAVAYACRMGFSYRTSTRIVSSFLAVYISDALKIFHARMNHSCFQEYEELLNDTNRSRIKLDMAFRIFLSSSGFIHSSSLFYTNIASAISLILKKIDSFTGAGCNLFSFLKADEFDRDADQVWTITVLENV